MNNLLTLLAVGVIYIGLPTVAIWGWLRWSKDRDLHHFFPLASFVAFLGAFLSGLLAIFSVLYVQAEHLTAYDHRWTGLLRAGLLISAITLLISFVGIWRRSALRWHAPICALGMLLLWIGLAAMD